MRSSGGHLMNGSAYRLRRSDLLRLGDLSRLRDRRRALAVGIIGLVGGLMVMVLIVHRDAAGVDAYAYWQGARTWLVGGDPYHPVGPWWPYVYAPWLLPLFAPWALLPWPIAWILWRGSEIVLVVWSLAWAYERRPLAAAIVFLLLSIPLGIVIDSANVAIFLIFAIWATRYTGPRTAALLWALATATKWIPALFFFTLSPTGRRWAVAFVGVAVLLWVATWPMTIAQLQVVGLLGVPTPFRGLAGLRVDHLVFLWATIPWLWGVPGREERPAAAPAQPSAVAAAGARREERRPT